MAGFNRLSKVSGIEDQINGGNFKLLGLISYKDSSSLAMMVGGGLESLGTYTERPRQPAAAAGHRLLPPLLPRRRRAGKAVPKRRENFTR